MNDIKHVFFCIDDGFINQLCVALVSVLENNPELHFGVHILSSDLSDESQSKISKLKVKFKNFNFDVSVPNLDIFSEFKLNIDYISKETYFRYIIADMFPEISTGLYLDADLVCNGNLSELFKISLDGYYAAGVRDIYLEQDEREYKQKLLGSSLYVNAGVMLFNLDSIRSNKITEKLIDTTKKLTGKIRFQDQDVLNIVFCDKVKEISNVFNFTSGDFFAARSELTNAKIIHWTGKNKPWNKKIRDKRQEIYHKYAKIYKQISSQKLKIGLIIDEFFGGAKTAFGGYGFLARKYIAKYIGHSDISIDVLLNANGHKWMARKYKEDDTKLYCLPRRKFWRRLWLRRKNYDMYLSIELTYPDVLLCEPSKDKKLILWIQDPRPKSAWNWIESMESIKDPCFYNQKNYDAVHNWCNAGRVKFISQGVSLNSLASELYNLPADTPIQYLPNPIDIDFNFRFDISKKKKQVIFLGRLEAQKRAWLFCEIARKMPEYEFFVLGQFFRYKEDNQRMLGKYMNGDIKNLHFVGHVDGAEKVKLISESRVLCSTAVWEGIPISWLEALSYGTLLVSDLERENLATRFGKFVGEIAGDGFDGVDKFIPAIRELMENDELYGEKAIEAIEYIRKVHNIPRFIRDMKDVIYAEFIKYD